MYKKNRLVLKFGTEALLGKEGKSKRRLDQKIFNGVADQVAALRRDHGTDVVIVSSGAIKAGKERMERLGINVNHLKLDKREIAGIGARHLLNRWGHAFGFFKMPVAQVWVTFANWESQPERRSVWSSILSYTHNGIIPIVNENDVVSDREIELMEKGISENDQLASMVALLIDADAVLFLTDVGGVYEKDPGIHPHARMYREIDKKTIIDRIFNSSLGASSNGAGGIKAKLSSALDCFNAGMRVAIAGVGENVIIEFVAGKPVGTMLGKISRFK